MSVQKSTIPQDISLELRMSPVWIAVGLVAFNLLVGLVQIPAADQYLQMQQLLIGLASFGAAITTALLTRRHKVAASWLALMAPLVILYGSALWLYAPALLVLVPVFIVLAVALAGLRAATAVAVGASLLLFLLVTYAFVPTLAAGQDLLWLVANLAAIWLTWAAALAIYLPLRAFANRAWQQEDRAQKLLEEARTRDADHAQTLDALKLAYRELDMLNERLGAMRLLAEDALRAKATFVAKVSHEFRTPLNMIIGLTDLLLNRPLVYGSNLPATLLEDLEIVHRNCEHLAGMIDDVLNLSRAESGSLNLQRRWCDLRAVCDAALRVVQPLIEKKELGLHVELPLDLPQVFVDETRIRQVIVNLLSNAARYTAAGEITLRARADSNAVFISVADTGLGITPEELVKVFEPFYQGTTAANRAQGGSGLGLSISKQLVELHDGELWVESTLGQGSTFFVSLPVGPLPVLAATPNRWLRDEWTWLDVRDRQPAPRLPIKPRVVVCDLGGGLSTVPAYRSDEVEIVAAASFAQAVTLALEYPSNALVLNAPTQAELLPLVEQARQQVADTPIVGCVLPSFASYVLAAGATACLTKPITLGALEGALHTARRSYQRILTVDDDPDFQVLLARMLGTFQPSAVVISAYDGEQALHELRRQRFDLVLLDIVMPRMTGWEVLARAQAMHLLDEVPVVVLSAQDAAEQPLASSLLVAAMGSRLTAATLLRCTLAVSETLLTPHRAASG